MLTLAINTSGSITEIALLDGDKILDEKTWPSDQNEAQKLMPEILKLIPGLREVKRIIAVSGPGSFTGLRVGITVANTLSYLTNAKLCQVDTFSVWNLRCNEGTLLIKAGRNEVFLEEEVVTVSEAATQLKGKKVFGDLMPDQANHFDVISDIRSFGEAIVMLKKVPEVSIITPNYKRPPKITISRDKWKKQKKLV